jgi:hypothetical protein
MNNDELILSLLLEASSLLISSDEILNESPNGEYEKRFKAFLKKYNYEERSGII